MNKHTDVYNVLDVKSPKGLWLKSYRPIPFVQYHTRAGIVWNSINYRTKRGVKYGTGTYEGCSIEFVDFQEFAEWCQGEFGYMNKDARGSYWPIDKDLLVPRSMAYSTETCMFIPQKVNSCFTLRQNHRGDFPVGVMFHNRDKIFEAACNDGKGNPIYLGRFDDPMLGHLKWVGKKIEIMTAFTKDEELKPHAKLMTALDAKIEHYKQCMRLGVEVKC